MVFFSSIEFGNVIGGAPARGAFVQRGRRHDGCLRTPAPASRMVPGVAARSAEITESAKKMKKRTHPFRLLAWSLTWALASAFAVALTLTAHLYYSSGQAIAWTGFASLFGLLLLFYAIVLVPPSVVFAPAGALARRLFGTKAETAYKALLIIGYFTVILYFTYRVSASSSHQQPGFLSSGMVFFLVLFSFALMWRSFFKIYHPGRKAFLILFAACCLLLSAAVLYGIYHKTHQHAAKIFSQKSLNIPYDKSSGNKVAIIGIDGASWHILTPLMEQGKLPHLGSIKRNGVHGPLQTYMPTSSPLIWTTIASGFSPGEHNIQGFGNYRLPGVDSNVVLAFPTKIGFSGIQKLFMRLGIGMTSLRSFQRKRPALWDIASIVPLHTAVVNWWASYPTYPVSGTMVSDRLYYLYGKKEEQIDAKLSAVEKKAVVFPPELQPLLLKMVVNPFTLDDRVYLRFMDVSKQEISRMNDLPMKLHDLRSEFKYLYSMDETYFRISRYLLEQDENDYRLVMIYLRGIDTISHCAMRYSLLLDDPEVEQQDKEKFGRAIEQYYIHTDRMVGELLKEIEDDYNVVILSDHGFSREGRAYWGHHRAPSGIIMMQGPVIRENLSLTDADVYDVAPTCLYLLGLPVGADMPGRVLKEAVEPGWLEKHPVAKIDTYGRFELESAPERRKDAGGEVDEKMLERLRALGYIQ